VNGRHPPLKPQYDRYRAVGYDSHIYLFEAGPVLKVGRAQHGATRLAHVHLMLERLGHPVGRFQAFPVNYSELHSAEQRCIKALQARAEKFRGREFFTGIPYEQAIELVAAQIAEPA
jgi:hypothetical protein